MLLWVRTAIEVLGVFFPIFFHETLAFPRTDSPDGGRKPDGDGGRRALPGGGVRPEAPHHHHRRRGGESLGSYPSPRGIDPPVCSSECAHRTSFTGSGSLFFSWIIMPPKVVFCHLFCQTSPSDGTSLVADSPVIPKAGFIMIQWVKINIFLCTCLLKLARQWFQCQHFFFEGAQLFPSFVVPDLPFVLMFWWCKAKSCCSPVGLSVGFFCFHQVAPSDLFC